MNTKKLVGWFLVLSLSFLQSAFAQDIIECVPNRGPQHQWEPYAKGVELQTESFKILPSVPVYTKLLRMNDDTVYSGGELSIRVTATGAKNLSQSGYKVQDQSIKLTFEQIEFTGQDDGTSDMSISVQGGHLNVYPAPGALRRANVKPLPLRGEFRSEQMEIEFYLTCELNTVLN